MGLFDSRPPHPFYIYGFRKALSCLCEGRDEQRETRFLTQAAQVLGTSAESAYSPRGRGFLCQGLSSAVKPSNVGLYRISDSNLQRVTGMQTSALERNTISLLDTGIMRVQSVGLTIKETIQMARKRKKIMMRDRR